jgi:hypothetical protein
MPSLADALALARAKLTGGRFGPATTHAVVNGHERCEPDGLALIGQAGSSSDAYSLARVFASECGSLPTTYAWCIGEAVQNSARAAGLSIFSRVTNPGAAYPLANRGYYGEQRTRWCSTYRDPLAWHHEVALAVLKNPDLDVSKGARRWISCKVQDGGVQNGRPLKNDSKGIVESWAGDGYEWVGPIHDRVTGVEIIDPYLQCMFRYVGKGAKTAPALAMIDERRRSAFVAKTIDGKPVDGGARDHDHANIGPIVLAAAGAWFAHTRGFI